MWKVSHFMYDLRHKSLTLDGSNHQQSARLDVDFLEPFTDNELNSVGYRKGARRKMP